MTDLLFPAGVTVLVLLAIVGLVVAVAQVRWWINGRKSIRETERVLRGRR